MSAPLNLLPQEILIKIFKHLSSSELLSLSSTCCAFNQAINSCGDLMKKFKIFITHGHRHLEWCPARKYSSVFVSCDNLKDFTHIFEDIGGEVENLEMKYCNVEADVLIKVLKCCKNLKQLKMHAVKLTVNADDIESPDVELNLDRLHILNLENSTEQIFKILSKSAARELLMLGEFRFPQLLKNFLRAQKELEIFKIYNQRDEYMLFDDDFLSDVEFKLKKLNLSNWDMYNQLTPFFRNFIVHHKDTLETFESNNWKVFNFLPACTALKSVTLSSTNFTTENVFESVEKIHLNQVDTYNRWSRVFPNAKALSIVQNHCLDPANALREIENFNKLEELEINYGKLSEFNIPKLRELTLKFLNEIRGCPINVANIKSIKRIAIEKCANAEWLIPILQNESLKLDSLEIQRTQISEELDKAIKSNESKIECLKVSPVGA